MPAPPEVLQGERHVGAVEVLRQLVAEQQREADRHVRVAREVAVDLRGERVERERDLGARVRGGVVVDGVDHVAGELVSDHGLLDQPSGDQEQSRPRQHLARVARRAQLREQLVGPHDRSGHEVREEGLKDRHVHERGGARLAPVHVHHVRDRLEGEERDPDRQHDLHERKWRPSPIPSSAESSSETKKPRYLKTHKIPRSNTTAAASARRVVCEGERAITCAAKVLTTLEPIRIRTQRQSTQP